MSSEYAVLCNMYHNRSVTKDDMATLKTKNFIIDIIREDVRNEFMDVQYCYRCVLSFKDLLGREVLRLIINEAQANILIDNISTFIYDDYSQLIALSNIPSTNIYETYTISIEAGECASDFIAFLKVLKYNSNTQQLIPVIVTQLDLDELDNLCNMMFFVYLIDLVDNREGIYKV